MNQSHAVLFVITAIVLVFLFIAFGALYPSTSGIISNSTLSSGATACKNCDSGVLLIGQNLSLMFIAVFSAVVITVVVIIAKKV